jgi:intermembrane space import and assembly protein 40
VLEESANAARSMQECFREHPDIYGEELGEDEDIESPEQADGVRASERAESPQQAEGARASEKAESPDQADVVKAPEQGERTKAPAQTERQAEEARAPERAESPAPKSPDQAISGQQSVKEQTEV